MSCHPSLAKLLSLFVLLPITAAQTPILTSDARFPRMYKITDDVLYDISVVDIDHDSDGDIIGGGPSGLIWHEYLGSNAWNRHLIETPGGYTPHEIASGDINGDGLLDIVSASDRESNGYLAWHENMGDTTFRLHEISTDSVSAITVADVNQDGHLDLIAASFSDGSCTVIFYRGRGGSWWSNTILQLSSTLQRVSSIVTTDVNGDGFADVVLTANSETANYVTWFEFSTSSESFLAGEHIYEGIKNPVGVSVIESSIANSNELLVTFTDAPNGNVIFRSSRADTGVWTQITLNHGDLEGVGVQGVILSTSHGVRGNHDIVALKNANTTVSWYENYHNGRYSGQNVVYSNNSNFGLSVAAGDINGDMHPDIALSFSTPHHVVWLQHRDCSSNSHCDVTEVCADGICEACQSNSQCEVGEVCAAGICEAAFCSFIVNDLNANLCTDLSNGFMLKAYVCNGQRAETDGCCTPSLPCGRYEGDRDEDADCAGELICGNNNCNAMGLGFPNSDWDCCVQACQSNSQCEVGEVCVAGICEGTYGASYLSYGGHSFDDNNLNRGNNAPINICLLAMYGNRPIIIPRTPNNNSFGTIDEAHPDVFHWHGFCSPGECQECYNSRIISSDVDPSIPSTYDWNSFSTGDSCSGDEDIDSPLASITCYFDDSPGSPFPDWPPSPPSPPSPAPTRPPAELTAHPSPEPTAMPTDVPSMEPTSEPSEVPTQAPEPTPTDLPSESPTASPTRPPVGCGDLLEDIRGAPTQKLVAVLPNSGSNVDFDSCCDDCTSNNECVSFSFFPGNQSADRPMCVLFDALLDDDNIVVEPLLGWYSATLYRETQPKTTATWTEQLFDENNAVTYILFISFGSAIMLCLLSLAAEVWTKRNLKFLIDEKRAELSSANDERNNETGTTSAHGSGESDEVTLAELEERLKKSGNHFNIMLIVLAFVDFIIDWFFVFERFRIEDTNDSNTVPLIPLLSAIFIVLPMLGNLWFVANLMRTEFNSDEMRTWFSKHSILGTMMALLALGNAEVLTMLLSGAFGNLALGSRFNAPFSDSGQERLHVAGLLGNFLEDIPQIVLQAIVMRSSDSSILTNIAMVTSVMTLAFGFLRRIFFIMLFLQKRLSVARLFGLHSSQQARDEISMTQLDQRAPSAVGGLPVQTQLSNVPTTVSAGSSQGAADQQLMTSGVVVDQELLNTRAHTTRLSPFSKDDADRFRNLSAFKEDDVKSAGNDFARTTGILVRGDSELEQKTHTPPPASPLAPEDLAAELSLPKKKDDDVPAVYDEEDDENLSDSL